MTTYARIAEVASQIGGFKTMKTCWIAHVMSDYGLTTRQAANRISPNERKHPCPDSKRPAIERALRRLGMI